MAPRPGGVSSDCAADSLWLGHAHAADARSHASAQAQSGAAPQADPKSGADTGPVLSHANPCTDATAGGLVLSASRLDFPNVGATFVQTFTASRSNYGGAFTPSDTCAGVASVGRPGAAPSFTVTPLAAGSCTITVSTTGDQKSLSVTVTTSSVTIQ